MNIFSGSNRSAVAGAIATFILASPASAIVLNGTDLILDSAYRTLADDYGSVGQFHTTDGTYQYAASGVVIADNWVLTAGHVAGGMTSMDFFLDGGGSWGSFDSRSGYAADQWVTHPKWSGSLASGYDIALVHFDQVLPGDQASLYMKSEEIGSIATAVGYGMTGTGATGATTFDGLKRAGHNVIDALYDTPGKPRDPDRILLMDFDSGSPADNAFGAAGPIPMESMIASGDSGGGLFIDCGDGSSSQCLAGITSFGWGLLDGNPNSDFGDAGGFTRVSAFIDWIMSVITPSSGGGSTGGSNGGKGGGPKKGASEIAALAVVDVPEPGAIALFGAGLFMLWAARRR
jgi:hypothetical protein